ncbi:hypothetical protein JT06_16150 [Desulfobulbus sp. Tol-SR]|nr:hypothetical protein JT06_16150 [Desulfobulbus sp. Tol-SR]
MDKLTKRECHVFNQPGIWDLIGWDSKTRQYQLRNDEGETILVFHNEFVPVSLAGEDLVMASEDGRILPTTEAIENKIEIALGKASEAPPLYEPKATGEKPQKARKAKGDATETADEARAKVRELLSGATSREEIAKLAAEPLGTPAEALVEKYAHLDNGRFRMVLGNRLASVFK